MGEALLLLAPEDEKTFRTMQVTLKRDPTAVAMLEVHFSTIERLAPIVKAATECETNIHAKDSADKQAKWILNLAKEGDLEMDDDMRAQIEDTLGVPTKRKKISEITGEDELPKDGEPE